MIILQYLVGVDDRNDAIIITRRDYTTDVWSIDNRGDQYNRFGEWEIPRMSSSRDDDYYKRLRYTYAEAVEIAKSLVKEEYF